MFKFKAADTEPGHQAYVDQIRLQILALITNDELRSGMRMHGEWGLQLPTMSAAGKQLGISFGMVGRVYQRLSTEGLIFTVHSVGTFLCDRDALLGHLRGELRLVMAGWHGLGLTGVETRTLLSELLDNIEESQEASPPGPAPGTGSPPTPDRRRIASEGQPVTPPR